MKKRIEMPYFVLLIWGISSLLLIIGSGFFIGSFVTGATDFCFKFGFNMLGAGTVGFFSCHFFECVRKKYIKI